jgi:hypothetical protein
MAGGGRKNIHEYVGIAYTANEGSMIEIWMENRETNTCEYNSTFVQNW